MQTDKAFAAAPPSADLQEMERRYLAVATGTADTDSYKLLAWDLLLLARRLSQPPPTAGSRDTEPKPPNESGSTQCIVRWMVETEAGWLGAWDKEAFAAYAKAAGSRPDYDTVFEAVRESWGGGVSETTKAVIEALSRGKPVEYHGPALDIKGGR